MCRVLEISTSGYYAWRQRPLSGRAREDARLRARIETIHAESRGTYGSPRVHAELTETGVRISRRRVARLMKQARLEGVSRRRRYPTTRRGNNAQVVPDLVKRNFRVEAANQLWVSDITYVSTWSGFLYLAIVLDAYSRRVVGWSMDNHLRTELELEALNMAIWQRCPEQVIHHRTRGRSTHPSSSASDANSLACAPRPAQSAMRTTTPWPRASSRRSKRSCCGAVPSAATRRLGWRSSSSSRASITPAGATRLSQDLPDPVRKEAWTSSGNGRGN